MAIPHLIEVDDAVSRIKQACVSRGKNRLSPFFFMVGAGISFPSVPLAPEIVSQCKQTANDYGRINEPKGKDSIDLYSHWFETAYGEPNQRQRYLRNLIEGRQITHANFRLAHLLLDSTITNIVVTTNFDDFLTKALTLFGKRHIVCDHPHMVGRINHTEPDLQIVHLHGTYWFYDCCNLRGELEDRALQSRQTTSTMASLLDMILWDRSPLIIGYSGWEGDVFMDALRRRLDRSLGSTVYWFCYRKDTVDALPDWLRSNANVRFNIPREKPIGNADASALRAEGADARKEVGERVEVKGIPVGDDDEPALPADMVLVKLIRAFDLQAPVLTNDPLGFFAEQLEDSLPKDEASDKDTDIYAIKNVIERVRKAKQRENEETAAAAEPGGSSLEPLRDALRRADYREAVKLARQIQLNNLSTNNLNEFSDAMWSAAVGLNDNSAEEVSAYELAGAISDRLSKVPGAARPGMTERAAKALRNKGLVFAALNRSEEALAAYDEVVLRYGESSDLATQEVVAKALVNKGFRLGKLNRNEEALHVYGEVVERYGDSPEPALSRQAATALVNKGFGLGALNRSEEALAAYEEVVRRYRASPEPAMRESVARALVNKGIRLGVLDRSEEAFAVYEEVVRRYGESPEPALRELVARTLANKGLTLGKLSRSDEELSVYDEVVRRYGESPEPSLREQVARALFNKGVTLGNLSRRDEELSVYDEVVRRYGESPEPSLQQHLAKALFNKGVTLGALNRNDEAVSVYDEVVRRYGESPESSFGEQVAKALLNKGHTLDALNRKDEAAAVHVDIVQRYGDSEEPTRQRIVASALNSLGFRTIIDAKASRLRGDETAAQEKLKEAEGSLTAALERDPDDPIKLGNQAYAAFLLGRKDEARALLTRAFLLGGERIRDTELKDADVNRLPEDDEFCEMVRSIPIPIPTLPTKD